MSSPQQQEAILPDAMATYHPTFWHVYESQGRDKDGNPTDDFKVIVRVEHAAGSSAFFLDLGLAEQVARHMMKVIKKTRKLETAAKLAVNEKKLTVVDAHGNEKEVVVPAVDDDELEEELDALDEELDAELEEEEIVEVEPIPAPDSVPEEVDLDDEDMPEAFRDADVIG